METAQGKKLPNRPKTSKLISEMVASHYADVRVAHEQGRLVAWCGGPAPMELLRTMDIAYVHSENYVAACAARKVGDQIMELAEKNGYSRDLCSYARIGIGSSLMGQYEDPVGGIASPDFLLCVNSICTSIVKWYEILAKDLKVPLFMLDVPYVHHSGELQREEIDYVKYQLYELVYFLEEQTGKKFDWDRAKEVIQYLKDAARLRQECLRLCKHHPAPMSSFDAFINLAPMNTKRGTREAVDYYTLLKKELEDRVAQGVAAIPEERHRLYWDHIAIWFRLKAMSELFAKYDAAVVAANYTNLGVYWNYQEINPEDPLEGIARELLGNRINRSLEWRIDNFCRLIEEFDCDGAIIHSARTCKRFDYGQHALAREIERRLGIPTIMFDADHTDTRYYAEAPIFTRLEAFLEGLGHKAGRVNYAPK